MTEPQNTSRLYDLIKTLPGYDPYIDSEGYYFDPDEAERVIGFAETLVHIKGELAGQKLVLEDWQKAYLANMFGWQSETDGTRRYRESFLFVPRKNGKSFLASVICLYMFFCDGEKGAEVVCAAFEQNQARLVWDVAKRQIQADNNLKANCKIYQHSIMIDAIASTLKPISAESRSAHGMNLHCAVMDELHVQRDDELVVALKTSMGSRKQPLMIHITTSDYERESVCNKIYDYAKNVMDSKSGVNDPTFLPAIYEASEKPRNKIIQSLTDLMRLDNICTCKHVKSTQINQQILEACVNLVMEFGGEKIEKMMGEDVLTILIEELDARGFVHHAMNNNFLMEMQNIKKGLSKAGRNGQKETQSELEKQTKNGEINQKTKNFFLNYQENQNTESPKKNTKNLNQSNLENVQFVNVKKNCALTIAMILEKLEGYYAINAMSESDFSKILKSFYEAHLDICVIRKGKLNSKSISIEVPGDDWTIEETWKKANPNYGVSVRPEYIKKECERAKNDPTYENEFKRLHLNIRTEQSIRYLQMADWDNCDGMVKEEDLRGRNCFGGLDLSINEDLSAFVLAFPNGNGGFDILPKFYSPRERALRRKQKYNVDYLTWANIGLITLTEGEVIDYDFIMADMHRASETYNLIDVGYDKWNAEHFRQTVEAAGKIKMIEFPQNFSSMNEPMKTLTALLKEGKIKHGGHPVLRWNASNLMAKTDPAGRVRPIKQKEEQKIDGIVALIMSIGRALFSDNDQVSVYESGSGIFEV